MAASYVLSRTWLENGPELHAASCKVDQIHVLAHSASLLVLTRNAPHPQGIPVMMQHCLSPKCNDMHCIHSDRLTSASESSLTSILLVRLATGRCHVFSATRNGRDSDAG